MIQYLELKEMSFYAYHGVMEQEKKVGNMYVVDLKIYFDNQKAFYTDLLQDSIDYVSVHEIVRQEMAIPSNLIEHVAYRIICKIREGFPIINNIELRLAKKKPPVRGDIREVAIFMTD